MNQSIQLHVANKVAVITLNRPEVFNSFNREMALSLQTILDACEANDDVRAIVLTGNGKAFCAGQDLKEVTANLKKIYTANTEEVAPLELKSFASK